MKKRGSYYVRKTHRYLGIFIGIQFLFWTLGGLYFSWNQIDNVHGDHLIKSTSFLNGNIKLSSPDSVIKYLKKAEALDSIVSLELINVLNNPVYRISYISRGKAKIRSALANAETGRIRGELTKEEAILMAKGLFVSKNDLSDVAYITEVGQHSEYRGKPLPAWVVRFNHSSNPSIYIGSLTGKFESIRHDVWRNFDFLWMLHTMDYSSRDNFGNVLLRSFSILGLITVLSGFLLFYISSPSIHKLRKRIRT